MHGSVVKRRLFFASVLAAGLATAGVLTQFGLGGSDRVTIGNGFVSALARPALASDALPRSVLGYPFAERNFADAQGAGARRLVVDGSLTLYAVPGKGSLVCLVEVDSAADTAGGACAQRDVLRTGAVYMADGQDGDRLVVGLVGDGHSYAEADGRRADVANNAFVLRHVSGSELRVGSPTAEAQVSLASS
jgi:hypothetical protein